jgi:hypothetical protein
MKTKIDRFY